MRVYNDVRPDQGKYALANTTSDAVVTIIPPAGEYVRISWLSWSFSDKVTDGTLRVRDTASGIVYLFLWLNDKTTGDKYYDMFAFGQNGEAFLVNAPIEITLHGSGASKALSVSYQ